MIKDKGANRGEKLVFTFPIAKFDEEKREVTGIATSEVVDSHGEILAYAGSKDALKIWAGNVREMHQPKAVGRKVSMEFDDVAKTITVRAKVSKGAEDTWQKVLDGTLACYSVGGIRIDTELKNKDSVPKEALKGVDDVPEEILYTSKWRMTELSLVDAGANPDSAISLVKDVNGTPTETEVLEEAPLEKKPPTPAERKNLPNASFAYVDGKGKGHYPIKNKDGEPDAAYVRSALSGTARAIKLGGTPADIARKAMPKIKACAKKLKIGQFTDDPTSVMLFYNIKKIRLEDGTEYASDTGLDKETLLGAAEMMKWPGGYAMEFSADPVDFMTAYERYQKDEALQEVYDILQIFTSCLTAIVFDQEMTDDEKKNLVAESAGQFVNIFVGAASDAAAKIDLEGDLRKRIEEIIMGVEAKKDEQPVLSADAVASMLKHALSAEVLGSALAKSIQPIVENQAKLEKTVTDSLATINERLEKVEKTPVTPANAPALKIIQKDGRSSALDRVRPANEAGTGTALRQNENNELVLEENGVEYTLPSVIKDIAALEKTLETQPPNDPLRLRNEVKAIALHRVRKILSGDKVWR